MSAIREHFQEACGRRGGWRKKRGSWGEKVRSNTLYKGSILENSFNLSSNKMAETEKDKTSNRCKYQVCCYLRIIWDDVYSNTDASVA